ncbi:MAG TPA: CHASE2 domain-containing protein, partial [Solirubrobacteraceae bacterium]|nr:CHASE2 domain-containing protein [Solirubrobacteraceae bacterium]
MRPRVGVVLAALVAVLVALAAPAAGITERLEGLAQDKRFVIRGAQPTDDVAVVAIDAEDITALDRWPIDRRWHGRAI